MSVTASQLYDLVECPKRVELDAFGDASRRDPENAFVRLLWERGSIFEQETIAKLEIPFLDLSGLESAAREKATLEAMKKGEPLIYGGRITSGDLIGMPDLLRKETGGYIPGDIKSGRAEEGGGEDEGDGKPKIHYAVQLGLYIDVLEKLGLSAGRRAFVWDIRETDVPYDFTIPRGPRMPETLWDEYQEALTEARQILSKQVTPLSAYGGQCKLCHWYTFCVENLEASDDLTLIPFLGRKIRDSMMGAVSTIAALAASNPEGFIDAKGKKTTFKGLGPDRLRLFHKRAVMLKDKAPKPFLRAPIVLRKTPLEIFFDIEVDPMRDIVYLHGMIERRGNDNSTESFTPYFAEEVTAEAEKEAFAQAIRYFTERPDAVIYFYSKYERTHYRKLQQKYPDVCSAEDIERIFSEARSVDLYGDIVLKATEWPTRDHSLKTLAKFLGFGWRDIHPSGAASIEWFDRWVRERDAAMKQRILDYNEDDCRATRVLLDGIRDLPA